MNICLGIGLSAACGFRVFVPLLLMSIASLSGHLHLAHGFEWVGSFPALLTFSVATCVEIAGYYIPWLDHLLDTIATPAAVLAGILVTASLTMHSSPLLKWALAIVAGGGIAGAVQASTVLARTTSTLASGGLGNPVVATTELAGSVGTSLLAFIAPPLVVLMVIVFLVFFGRKLVRRFYKPKPRIK